MATQPSEVDTTVNDGSSIKRGKRRRSVTEINNDGWDETKKVADVLRGGQRAKGNDGKSEMQRNDPGLLELFAICTMLPMPGTPWLLQSCSGNAKS